MTEEDTSINAAAVRLPPFSPNQQLTWFRRAERHFHPKKITNQIKSNQIKSNQIKFFISINNDDNNRYSTYKGNIVMCIIIHLHTFKYIYTHTYY